MRFLAELKQSHQYVFKQMGLSPMSLKKTLWKETGQLSRSLSGFEAILPASAPLSQRFILS
ncbi:MAG: hypothetical protein WCP96_21645 [Methylococcaceae bacterium]